MDEELMILGLILQFIVGILQLIVALVQTVSRLGQNIPLGNLKMYWLLVACYSIGLYLLYMLMISDNSFETPCLIWFLSAWGIAVYYMMKGRK